MVFGRLFWRSSVRFVEAEFPMFWDGWSTEAKLTAVGMAGAFMGWVIGTFTERRRHRYTSKPKLEVVASQSVLMDQDNPAEWNMQALQITTTNKSAAPTTIVSVAVELPTGQHLLLPRNVLRREPPVTLGQHESYVYGQPTRELQQAWSQRGFPVPMKLRAVVNHNMGGPVFSKAVSVEFYPEHPDTR